eukprot:742775-Amphidinium_carterae.1
MEVNLNLVPVVVRWSETSPFLWWSIEQVRLVQHSPSTPKAALKEEVAKKEPKAKAKAKVPTFMINAHTVCSASFEPNADQVVADYVKQPKDWDHAYVQGPSVQGCSNKGGKGNHASGVEYVPVARPTAAGRSCHRPSSTSSHKHG